MTDTSSAAQQISLYEPKRTNVVREGAGKHLTFSQKFTARTAVNIDQICCFSL
jgi:hypothetical protein